MRASAVVEVWLQHHRSRFPGCLFAGTVRAYCTHARILEILSKCIPEERMAELQAAFHHACLSTPAFAMSSFQGWTRVVQESMDVGCDEYPEAHLRLSNLELLVELLCQVIVHNESCALYAAPTTFGPVVSWKLCFSENDLMPGKVPVQNGAEAPAEPSSDNRIAQVRKRDHRAPIQGQHRKGKAIQRSVTRLLDGVTVLSARLGAGDFECAWCHTNGPKDNHAVLYTYESANLKVCRSVDTLMAHRLRTCFNLM